MLKNTKGIVAPVLLLVLAAAGLVSYLLVSSSIPLKNELLSRLYPKPPAQAYCSCEYSDLASYSGQSCSSGYAVYSGSNPNGTCVYDPGCSTFLRCADGGGGSTPPSSGGACSGDACTDCILNNRTDILKFYADNGWSGITDCSNPPNTNQIAVVDNWCGIDPSGCYNISTTTCNSVCGGGSNPTPTPTPVNQCSTPGAQGEACVTKRCSDGSACATGHKYCVWASSGNYWSDCSQEVDNCATQCGGTGGTSPTPVPTNSFNLAFNCINGPELGATWITGSTGTNCNVHIYAGTTAYKVSGDCTNGSWTGNILPGGPTIVNGGVYKLCVNNPGGNQLGCSKEVTISCQGIPTPVPTPTPTPSSSCGTPQFKYNQCVACNKSEPVYQDACGNWSTGPKQTDSECGSWCTTYKNACGTESGKPNCTYSQADSSCASGLTVCSGVVDTQTSACVWKNNCSSCSCYVPDPVPSPTANPSPTATLGPTGSKANSCGGRYDQNVANPYKWCKAIGNFGDSDCEYVNKPNFGQDELLAILKSDSRLVGKTTTYGGKSYPDADIWFYWLINPESGYNPNNVNSNLTSPRCGSASNEGAFGFAQMGGHVILPNGKIYEHNNDIEWDWGDVPWRQQINNFLDYQQFLIRNGVCKWNYWEAVSRLWGCKN